jgi:hypothetical protein
MEPFGASKHKTKVFSSSSSAEAISDGNVADGDSSMLIYYCSCILASDSVTQADNWV